jgi:hypothetical protein
MATLWFDCASDAAANGGRPPGLFFHFISDVCLFRQLSFNADYRPADVLILDSYFGFSVEKSLYIVQNCRFY